PQTVGVQGLRDGLHARDPHRHLHGLVRGRLRRLLQLRPLHPPARRGGRPARPAERGGGAGRRSRGRRGGGMVTIREEEVLERIARARSRKPRRREDAVTLAHGSGGKATHTLIEPVFREAFANPRLDRLDDPAHLDLNGTRLAFTTDSYVVSPLFFPGGDIGDLAVNGTVNDLAVSGATPLHLSA